MLVLRLDLERVFVLVFDLLLLLFFFFSSRRRHTRFDCDWSSDVCSSDLCSAAMLATVWRRNFSSVRASAILLCGAVATSSCDCSISPMTCPPVIDLSFARDRKSTRLNSSHSQISYAVFCLKKKTYTTHMN